ncbi:MAG: hypothetical protein ABJP45_08700 [Cyclobacteriaceae bacterium]
MKKDLQLSFVVYTISQKQRDSGNVLYPRIRNVGSTFDDQEKIRSYPS